MAAKIKERRPKKSNEKTHKRRKNEEEFCPLMGRLTSTPPQRRTEGTWGLVPITRACVKTWFC
jgi:hypothetical protein